MGRGTIYYVTTNKYNGVDFDESDYYDDLSALQVDYVENESKENSEVSLSCLRKTLQEMGAITGYGKSNGHFAFSFCFSKLEKAQQKYFKPKLEKLKKQVEDLTLFDVIKSAPCLDFIMDNDCGDLIELHDHPTSVRITLDNFIRILKPGVTYYVYEKVIFMH